MIDGKWHTVCHSSQHPLDYFLERYVAKACEKLVGYVDVYVKIHCSNLTIVYYLHLYVHFWDFLLSRISWRSYVWLCRAPTVSKERIKYHLQKMSPFAKMTRIESSFAPERACSSELAYYVCFF